MSYTQKPEKFTMNTDIRLEPILLSLSDDNWEDILNIISQSVETLNPEIKKTLDKYSFIAKQQLDGKHLSSELLKTEFSNLIFTEVNPLPPDQDLWEYTNLYVNQLKHRAFSEKLMDAADTVRTQGLTQEVINTIYQYAEMNHAEEKEYQSIADTFAEEYKNKETTKGISFLCPELDKNTGGIQPGSICTILGGSGNMKTTYASNIIFNAMKEGSNILFLSMEETPFQLYQKLLSRASIDLGKPLQHQDIIQRKLTEKDEEVLIKEVYPHFTSFKGKLYLLGEGDLPDYSFITLENKFKEIDKKAQAETDHGIDIVVVDHIQLLKFAVPGAEMSATNMYVSFFRQQSLNWLHSGRQIIFILLSQANREGIAYSKKHDGQYMMQHVAEASEVERASSYIITVFTDDMVQITKLLKVGAIKLRSSQLPMNTIQIYADGAYYQVGDTDIPEQQDYSASMLFDNNAPTGETLDSFINQGSTDNGFLDDLLKGVGL